MRSRLLGVVIVCLVVVAGALLLFRGGGGRQSYKVDAIFDVARGIGPQQEVKIAGAEVGTVVAVRLTSDDKARVEMEIDPQFGPFRANASCQIEPEGIISENFVECSPGSPSSPVLSDDGSGTPTVPLSHTAEPISLQDLFDIWTVPVSDRLTVLLDELGIGVSGQDTDIAGILKRANPALAAADQAIGLVNGQRRQLQRLLDAAAPVVAELSTHDIAVQRFISDTARVTTITGTRSSALSEAIARLPALLRSAQPALAQLAGLGSSATPLLADLRAATPALSELTEQLPPFSTQGVATLSALRSPLADVDSALSAATPTLKRAAQFATDADPAGESLDRLLVSLRDSGAIESLLRSVYNGAALTSHYDAQSHVIFADMLENQCLAYSTVNDPLCDAHLNGTATIPGEPDDLRKPAPVKKTSSNSTGSGAGPVGPATTTTIAAPTATTVASPATSVIAPTATTATQTLKRLLGFLLK